MEAVGFVFKTTVVTVAVILVMQIKWGNQTIERHTMRALTSASLVKPINETARGAAHLLRNVWGNLWTSRTARRTRATEEN